MKGPSHSHIGRHPSLEERWVSQRSFPFADIALEISCQGIAEASDDIIIRGGDLLKMDHIRFGEDTASSCNPGRVLRLEGKLPKLFNGQAEPACLLIQKGACACRTEGVHREVADLESGRPPPRGGSAWNLPLRYQ